MFHRPEDPRRLDYCVCGESWPCTSRTARLNSAVSRYRARRFKWSDKRGWARIARERRARDRALLDSARSLDSHSGEM